MEQLAAEIRRLVYTVICFQCLIQLMEGSAYRKYIKVFSYLITMYICCNVVFSFAGQLENSLYKADELYSDWESEWRGMMGADNITSDINSGEAYYRERLWEDKIIGGAREEYERQSASGNEMETETGMETENGGGGTNGENSGQTEAAD